MKKLIAGTQYNDWKGDVAFDDADFSSLSEYAKQKGKIKQSDVIFGVEAFYLDVSKEFSVRIYVSDKPFDEVKQYGGELEEVKFDLPLSDFFSLFKRVSLAFSRKGMMA